MYVYLNTYVYIFPLYICTWLLIQIYLFHLHLIIICKVAFWQGNCPSQRTIYKFSHMLVRLPNFYKMHGLNKADLMCFKKEKHFFLKEVPKMQQESLLRDRVSPPYQPKICSLGKFPSVSSPLPPPKINSPPSRENNNFQAKIQ